MIQNPVSRLWRPARTAHPNADSAQDIQAFIESRSLEYPSQLEDAFVNRVLSLGVESGMILDVGTRAGLVLLKILWQNENFYAIGMDSSTAMIERARETAEAWGLSDRAFFQVGDARHMRFKEAYFDIVVSDSTLHRFDDVTGVLREVSRVIKPKGALLIRDFARPNRWKIGSRIEQQTVRHTTAMRPQLESAIRASYTRNELHQALREARLAGAQFIEDGDSTHLMIERRGETDPGSWVIGREQYR
jgi:ubiquinone/menaquinone biosynthesis C-methylase UbiE